MREERDGRTSASVISTAPSAKHEEEGKGEEEVGRGAASSSRMGNRGRSAEFGGRIRLVTAGNGILTFYEFD